MPKGGNGLGDDVRGLLKAVKAAMEFWSHIRCSVSNALGNGYGYEKDGPKVIVRLKLKDVDAEIDAGKKTLRDIDDTISNINGKLEVEVDL